MGADVALKKHIIEFLCSKPVQTVINPMLKHNAVIFMLHRFSNTRLSTKGHDPDFLSECLFYLKSVGRNVIGLDELFLSLNQQSAAIPNSVVFTIDDGFLDQAEICQQTFNEHSCPVTVCVVSQLVSQTYWLAESRIAYVLENTLNPKINIDFDGHQFQLAISSTQERNAAINELIFHCKSLTLAKVEQVVSMLSTQLEVEIPVEAPLQYRGMNWEVIRSLEDQGTTFCAHTETHPALSAESDERSKEEISESFNSLKRNTNSPSHVFCYPTGRPNIDYTERDILYVKEAGFAGALSSVPGYVNLKHPDSVNLYSVPRFSFPDNLQDFKQVIHHIEAIKDGLRRGIHPKNP